MVLSAALGEVQKRRRTHQDIRGFAVDIYRGPRAAQVSANKVDEQESGKWKSRFVVLTLGEAFDTAYVHPTGVG
ncbi:hypothetical protein E4T56_gene1849 [Termitomyces sp. T112]|nr:hypothetical protein E4T56_gene1849 [Termitomyces sp. T112]